MELIIGKILGAEGAGEKGVEKVQL
jgi:hypothetical protein